MPSFETPPPGTQCAKHRGRPATAYCGVCYQPMCEECRDSSSTEPRCRRCSVTEILTQVEEQWDAKTKRRTGEDKHDESTESQKRLLRSVTLGAVALVVTVLMMTSLSDTFLSGHTVYAVNLPAEGGPSLNGCLREMWKIRAALEAHLARHGEYPHTLEEAMDGKIPRCPACNRSYEYTRIDALHYLVLCPEPERHNVSGVRINSGNAPAILDRQQD